MTHQLKIQIAQAIADRAYKDGEVREGYDHVEGEDFGADVHWVQSIGGTVYVSVDAVFSGPDGEDEATPIELEEITTLARNRIPEW